MVRVGCRGAEDANAAVSSMSEGRVLAGWLASLPAAWSRGKLDFGSSSLILSLFMHSFLGGFHYFLVCILIIFYFLTPIIFFNWTASQTLTATYQSLESWDWCDLADGACNTRCYWQTAMHRRCSPAMFACYTRCYRRISPVRTGDVAPIPTFHGLLYYIYLVNICDWC